MSSLYIETANQHMHGIITNYANYGPISDINKLTYPSDDKSTYSDTNNEYKDTYWNHILFNTMYNDTKVYLRTA